jgi:hypothetical protein
VPFPNPAPIEPFAFIQTMIKKSILADASGCNTRTVDDWRRGSKAS